MPPVRIYSRRRSSIANGLTNVKAGVYGIRSPSPSISISGRPLQFAPNVTPGTYNAPPSPSPDSDDSSSPVQPLFPAPQTTQGAPRPRRRQPPGKRLSQGYIPRPPNAFMLFRAAFVTQKHVPGSIETSHGSLSKIIGNCWRALPLDEKAVWERRAKEAKIQHQKDHPGYRFRPVHNKHKKPAAEAASSSKKVRATEDEERRCEEVAQLLLEGKKGDELAQAVKELDMRYRTIRQDRRPTLRAPQPHHRLPRRSSSVPPPTTISLPPAPFLTISRSISPTGPITSIARTYRGANNNAVDNDNLAAGMYLHQRRASTAQPRLMDVDHVAELPWGNHPGDFSFRETYLRYQEMMQHSEYMPAYDWQSSPEEPPMFHDWMGQAQYDREPSPVPEVDASLFEKSFLEKSFSATTPSSAGHFNLNTLYTSLPPDAPLPTDPQSASSSQSYNFPTPPWYNQNPSLPSSQYSGSPAPSIPDSMIDNNTPSNWNTQSPSSPDTSLDMPVSMHAPQPQHIWGSGLGLDLSQQQQQVGLDMSQQQQQTEYPSPHDINNHLGLDMSQQHQQQLQQQMEYAAPHDINGQVGYELAPHEYTPYPPKAEAPTSPLLHEYQPAPAQQMYEGFAPAMEFEYHNIVQDPVY